MQLVKQPSVGRKTRLQEELAQADLSQLSDAIIMELGIESVERLRGFSFEELVEALRADAQVTLKRGQVQPLKDFLSATGEAAQSPSLSSSVVLGDVLHGRRQQQPPLSHPIRASASLSEQGTASNGHADGHAPSFVLPPGVRTHATETLEVTIHLSAFDEAAPLSAAALQRKAADVRARLLALGHSGITLHAEIVTGKPFLPRCQDMPPEAFLPPATAAELFARGRRHILVLSYCWRSQGLPDPDGRTLAKIRGHLREVCQKAVQLWSFAGPPL